MEAAATALNKMAAICQRGRFLAIPCMFPDLRNDRQLKKAIRSTIKRQVQTSCRCQSVAARKAAVGIFVGTVLQIDSKRESLLLLSAPVHTTEGDGVRSVRDY